MPHKLAESGGGGVHDAQKTVFIEQPHQTARRLSPEQRQRMEKSHKRTVRLDHMPQLCGLCGSWRDGQKTIGLQRFPSGTDHRSDMKNYVENDFFSIDGSENIDRLRMS